MAIEPISRAQRTTPARARSNATPPGSPGPTTADAAERRTARPKPPPSTATLRKEIDSGFLQTVKQRSDQVRAERAVARTQTYFERTFGRDGFDDRGTDVTLDMRPRESGASAQVSRDGRTGTINVGFLETPSGTRYSAGHELSVIAHEYAHLVLTSEVRDSPTPTDPRVIREHRAIQEGMADVFGAAAERDWDLAGIRNPAAGTNIVTHQRDVDPMHTDAHVWGGVIGNAAADMQQRVGWSSMEQAFYGAMTDPRMTQSSTMQDLATFVVDAARRAGDRRAEDAARAAFADNGLM